MVALGLSPARGAARDRDRLTPQELSVANLAATGMSNREIAGELVISVKTVEFHLSNVFAKLGVTSRARLARAWRKRRPWTH
jgi:DNA-binding NarL/FixJ family response regulator